MRIGIDARMYGPKQGGLGRYIEQLVAELEKIDTTNEYVVFLCRANWEEYSPNNPHFTKKLADIPWYGWREQLQFAQILGREHVDLMHFPHWNVPILYGCKFIVTIHDLILIHHPNRRASTLSWPIYILKYLAHRLVLFSALHRAEHILVPTKFGKQDLHNTLKIPTDKITVTPLATTIHSSPHEKTSGILTKHHITTPYALYVGAAYPHKNLERLTTGWRMAQEKLPIKHTLVLAGRAGYFYRRLRNTAHPTAHIVFTNLVPDADLAELYQKSSLYIFPSLYEGFGLPPLEAIQYNVPVISSQASCLPEVLQNAALFFDPESPSKIADAIIRGLFDESLRSELRRNAKQLLPHYSWHKTAGLTRDIYQRFA